MACKTSLGATLVMKQLLSLLNAFLVNVIDPPGGYTEEITALVYVLGTEHFQVHGPSNC